MANFVLPFLPAIRPIALDKLSPFNGLTTQEKRTLGKFSVFPVFLPSLISNDSRKRSSRRINASASSTSKPSTNALTKSAKTKTEK